MGGVLKLRIQLRRDTVANWTKYDPVLLNGEVAVSSDINKFKIGNGKSKWSELPYIEGESIPGINEAAAGTYPIKQSDGTLKWVAPSGDAQKTSVKLGEDVYFQNEVGTVAIPNATLTKLGAVKGSSQENQIAVLEDGTMELNTVNANKLVQTLGDSLILYSGDADTE